MNTYTCLKWQGLTFLVGLTYLDQGVIFVTGP